MKKGFKPPHQAVQFTDFSTQQHRILEKEIEQDKEKETKKEKEKKEEKHQQEKLLEKLIVFQERGGKDGEEQEGVW